MSGPLIQFHWTYATAYVYAYVASENPGNAREPSHGKLAFKSGDLRLFSLFFTGQMADAKHLRFPCRDISSVVDS